MSRPFWLSAFLDFPPDRYDAGVAFWEDVTGFRRSAGERNVPTWRTRFCS